MKDKKKYFLDNCFSHDNWKWANKLGEWKTNQLDKKQTDYKKAATMLCIVNGIGQTN